MDLLLSSVALVLLLVWIGLCRRSPARPSSRRRRSQVPDSTPVPSPRYRLPKPPWVRQEVLRLKALMPASGCRKIAITFNHLHQHRRGVSVGKSYVANVLRDSQEEVLRLHTELKHRRPRRLSRNLTWAMDLTTTAAGDPPILGVLDHGTRACLALRTLRSKASIVILRKVLDLVERYGRPKYLRTDNEAIFTSRLFRLGLALLGIRQQRSAPFAPWQNGRIEKFFGTFKEAWQLRIGSGGSRAIDQDDLDQYRAWYHHLRPHQHLDGWMPAWAWAKKMPNLRRKPRLYSAWEGVLGGYYWKP
jgi:transposase InsO family protein